LPAAIEILDLQKTYKVGFWHKHTKVGLHPLRLTIEEGEVFGFLGPNGAGKTTTLKLLMGLVFPTGGTAKILGRAMDDPEVKSQIGFLPEQPYFYDHLTAKELLNYYGQLSGVPAKIRASRVEQMLDRVGLSDSAEVQLRKFSKGMLQRVGLAQAILHDPRLVFLDEPMSGLDPMGRREVRDMIQQLRHEGKTVFFSTHILSDAEALCDRVGVIQQGELRGVGAVAELMSQAQGRVEIIFHASRAPVALLQLGAEAKISGDIVNAVLPEKQQDAALEVLRRERLQLISLNPVRRSLEEYYIQNMAQSNGAKENRKGVGV
jgi:ABC-2 type transport system ATP-binding protein